MKVQYDTVAHTPAPHEISGVVDALVTTHRGADGSLAFHLVVGPADRPEECDRIEFALDPEHARALLGAHAGHRIPGDGARSPVPCRVGVEFHAVGPAHR
ncbi:hypothetical protein ACWCP6_06685 [Streptomyces sp. NPDC002004]